MRDSLFIWAARARGWKVAAHIRNSLFPDFYASQPAVLRAWVRVTMNHVTSAAVLAESLRPLMDGFVYRDRVEVVPNGTPPFNQPSQTRDPDLVIYLSNICRKKGGDLAMHAASLVCERRPQTRFIFAGDWESPAFESQTRRLAAGLGDRVEFAGPVSGDAKAELMATASVLLFPVAWGEGHPRVILEAMAAGLPVVTTDRASIADTVGDGKAGFVLRDPEPEELAARLAAILDDCDLRERMGQTARERWSDRFTQERADLVLSDWLKRVLHTEPASNVRAHPDT